MTIAFQNIPGNIRVPFFYGEVRAGAQGYQQNSALLLIHFMNGVTSGVPTATPGLPVQIFGNEDGLFGIDSPLAQMVKIARKNAPFQTVWGLPLAAPSGGAASVGTITFTATAARSASANFYVNGQQERFTILSGDTPTAMAAKLVAALNADVNCPVLGSNVAGVVSGTANLKGTWGNDIKFAVNLFPDDDPYFSTIATIVQPTGGAGDGDITTPLANLGDTPFDWIALGFHDGANVALLESFFSDVSGRWGPYSQLYGHGFWGKDEIFASLATDGQTHNSQHCSFLGQYNYNTPPYLRVAAIAAISAAQLSTFPSGSAPLQTLPLLGVVGPTSPGDRPTIQERQSLYFDGVSMDRFDELTGEAQIDRVLTTYQHNAYGSPDITFLDINTPAQVMYSLRRFQADFTQNYGRVALADTNPFNVSNMVTPPDLKAQAVHTYTSLVKDGCLEGADVFAANLEIERDANDPNRVNMILPLDVVNQLRILAVAAIVYLQNQSVQGS